MNIDKFKDFSYLVEIRQRLLLCCTTIIISFIIFFHYANEIYTYLSLPLLKYLPFGFGLIATSLSSAAIVPLTLAFNLAILINIPFILWQIWQFILPALYDKEKKLFFSLSIVSIVSFILGMIFCYFIALPMIFKVLLSLLPKNISLLADMQVYLDFIFDLLIIFGCAFQIPVIISAILKLQLCSLATIKRIRPYYIVVSAFLSMILTPPDVVSMVILLFPMILLFELGIICNTFIRPLT